MHRSGSKRIQIGTYGTAVKAAVAFAKYMASIGGAEPEEEAEEAEVVVDGYSLLRSRKSSTGYLGVYPEGVVLCW